MNEMPIILLPIAVLSVYVGLFIECFRRSIFRGFLLLGITAPIYYLAGLCYKSAEAKGMSDFLTLEGISWWLLAALIWIVLIVAVWEKKSLPIVIGISVFVVYFIGFFWYITVVFPKIPESYSSTIGSIFYIASLLLGAIGIFVFPILAGWETRKLIKKGD